MRNFLSFTFSELTGTDYSSRASLARIERNIAILKNYKKPHSPLEHRLIQLFYFFKNKIYQTIRMDGRDSGLGELTGGTNDYYLLDVIYCTSRDISAILRKEGNGDPKNVKIITDGRVITNIIDFLNTLSEVHGIDEDEWAEFLANSGLSDSAKVEYLKSIMDSVRAKERDIRETRYSLSQIKP